MSEFSTSAFKKRIQNLSKVDRRLSPLNPAAVQRDGTLDGDSGGGSVNPPAASAPVGSLSAGYTGTGGYQANLFYTPNTIDSDSDQSIQGPTIRKRSVGLNLRKLAVSEQFSNGSSSGSSSIGFMDKNQINYASDSDAVLSKKLPKSGPFKRETSDSGTIPFLGVQSKKYLKTKSSFLNDTRSIMLFRSTSMVNLPKWSVTPTKNEIVLSASNTPATLAIPIALRAASPLGKDAIDHTSLRKRSLTKHYIKIIEDSPRNLIDKLERFASTLSAKDVQMYTSIVEHSRRSKNFLWLREPIAIWPDWHEGLIFASPISPIHESYGMFGTSLVRPPSRGRSIAPSPILSPLPISSRDSRSLSPSYRLERNLVDSETDSALDPNNMKSKIAQGLSIITNRKASLLHSGPNTPEQVEISSAISNDTPKMIRSHSDGDLTEYLKGFTDLKGCLEIAQDTCNNEIRKILEELQEHVEKSLEISAARDKNEFKILLTSSNANIREGELRGESNDGKLNLSTFSLRTCDSSQDMGSGRVSEHKKANSANLHGSEKSVSRSLSNLLLPNRKISSLTRSSESLAAPKSMSDARSSSLSNNKVGNATSTSSVNSSSHRRKIYDSNFNSDTSDDELFDRKQSTGSFNKSKGKALRQLKSDSFKLAADLNLYSTNEKDELSINSQNTPNPFLEAISSVISLAQKILDLDLNSLMNPQIPQYYISEILKLQNIWTQNPDWQLQELVVRLLIVFASVARLAEHFEEDFRSWNNLATNSIVTNRDKRLRSFQNRRDSVNSLKSSPKIESPLSILKSGASFSYGADSSDTGDYDDYYSDDHNSFYGSPKRPTGSIAKKNFSDTYMNRESMKAFKNAVDEDQSMNVLMELNASGKVTYISPAVQKVFQYSQLDIIGSNSLLFLSNKDSGSNPFRISAANCVKEKPNLEICIDARRADGRCIKVECHGLVNFDSLGVIQSVVWLMRPVKLSRGDDSSSLLTSDFINRMSEIEVIPNVDMALCNICDKSVPAIHFSIHTDACLKVHKTEMDLMLLNDEMKILRKALEEKLEVLRGEIEWIKQEVSLNESDLQENVPNKQMLLEFYNRMSNIGSDILQSLEQLLAIKIPKQELLGVYYDEVFDSIEKISLAKEDFVCDADTYGFGSEFMHFEKSFRTFFDQKRLQTSRLIEELLSYLECLEAEHILTIEIGLQTAAISDTRFEMKEIGGVLVNVPSMQNLDSNNPVKDSVFFQSSPHPPLRVSNDLDDEFTPNQSESLSSSPKKKSSKPNVLRIQTDQELVEGRVSRMTPFRNTRMVVDDKAFEVDSEINLSPPRTSQRNSILSPGLPSAHNSFYGSALPSAHNSFYGPAVSATGPRHSYTHISRNSSLSQLASAQASSRNNPLQNFRSSNAGRQLSFNVPSTTPLGSASSLSSNLNIPRAFSISGGGSPSPTVSQPSIKDYEIIKPISKGAFGSVFLAKKKISGQYFAIKVLRKSDMVAKNQASNIKSERTILTQLDSPYVVKLFSTFQSKNHIFLVMEYLNGGDCAALLKSLGQLDEDWAKQYITEMVEGLSFLHQRDIVHRDLKPDNMLIDITGHIKLTDFGLSKAGFLGRRALGVGDVSTSSRQTVLNKNLEFGSSSAITPSFASLKSSRRDSASNQLSSESFLSKENESGKKPAVGTPDYLAPESILGLGQGVSVDWWACGVILYEFLYGIPPFHAETPPLVFENILLHRIDWLEGQLEISSEARELMENLMCHDVEKRIGTKSSDEVKNMAWFKGTNWEHLSDQKVYFVPTVKNIEDTFYFDSRGVQKPVGLSDSDESVESGLHTEISAAEDQEGTDFGGAVMKNLPLLEKENQKTANKINQDFPEGEAWMQKRRDSLPLSMVIPYGPIPHSPSISSPIGGPLRSVSPLHFQSVTRRESLPLNSSGSPSPTKLSPKKASRVISSSSLENMWQQKALEHTTSQHGSSNSISPVSMPSIKDEEDFISRKRSQAYLDIAKQNLNLDIAKQNSMNQGMIEPSMTNPLHGLASTGKLNPEDGLNVVIQDSPQSPMVIDALIAESNPAAALVLENILRGIGCRCVRVKSGAEVVQCAMGEIKFGIIFCDVNLPVMNGDTAARMIQSTSNINSKTPIVLLTATDPEELDLSIVAEFKHIITKPVSHANVINALKRALELPLI